MFCGFFLTCTLGLAFSGPYCQWHWCSGCLVCTPLGSRSRELELFCSGFGFVADLQQSWCKGAGVFIGLCTHKSEGMSSAGIFQSTAQSQIGPTFI
jgi:hypothetical protein